MVEKDPILKPSTFDLTSFLLGVFVGAFIYGGFVILMAWRI